MPLPVKQPLPLPITFTQTATQYTLTSVTPNLTAGTLVGTFSLFDGYGAFVKSSSVSVPFSGTDTITDKLTALLAGIK